MKDGSLHAIFASVHESVRSQLVAARQSFSHPGAKGDASEDVWLELLNEYLPARYRAEKAFVVDSNGCVSDQIDVVIFDQQYSPFLFRLHGQTYIPAESVYAVFESKQSISLEYVKYAQDKVASVRGLHRTSLPIPYAGGTYPPKPLIPIVGGILSLESNWKPALGGPLEKALKGGARKGLLDLGCVAEHGVFLYDPGTENYHVKYSDKAATAFIFELIARLQFSGTVPMIDVLEYARFLDN